MKRPKTHTLPKIRIDERLSEMIEEAKKKDLYFNLSALVRSGLEQELRKKGITR